MSRSIAISNLTTRCRKDCHFAPLIIVSLKTSFKDAQFIVGFQSLFVVRRWRSNVRCCFDTFCQSRRLFTQHVSCNQTGLINSQMQYNREILSGPNSFFVDCQFKHSRYIIDFYKLLHYKLKLHFGSFPILLKFLRSNGEFKKDVKQIILRFQLHQQLVCFTNIEQGCFRGAMMRSHDPSNTVLL